jgi:hypothetical protein
MFRFCVVVPKYINTHAIGIAVQIRDLKQISFRRMDDDHKDNMGC